MASASFLRAAKIAAATIVGVGVVACAIGVGNERSILARTENEAVKLGLPISDTELSNLVGPLPSADDALLFKELPDVREWSGLADLDDQAPLEKRVATAAPFLKSAEVASHVKSYRFTRSWNTYPPVLNKEMDATRRAVGLFCGRAFLSAKAGKRGECLDDLEAASRLTLILGQDPSQSGGQSLFTGRRRVCDSLANCLGLGDWNPIDLARARHLLKSMDQDIDPRPYLAGQFAAHRWMCDNTDKVFQAMKDSGTPFDSSEWLSMRIPGATGKLKVQMIEAAVAAHQLFADAKLTPAKRLVKADELASRPGFSHLEGQSLYWFVSPQPVMWANGVLSDRARRETCSALLECLELKAKSEEDWKPVSATDPYSGRPVQFEKTETGFRVSCNAATLNDNLRSVASNVTNVSFSWPYSPDSGGGRMAIQGILKARAD